MARDLEDALPWIIAGFLGGAIIGGILLWLMSPPQHAASYVLKIPQEPLPTYASLAPSTAPPPSVVVSSAPGISIARDRSGRIVGIRGATLSEVVEEMS